MSDVAIRVEGLGKRYRLGARQRTYRDFREHIVEAVKLPFRRLRSALSGGSTILSDESIWALQDVSFDVEEGEVVGVIGRNGAGKTTLLKVLSRITEPTEGRAEIHGRVASLLEVGTGFHPELTGRENVYLNGAILGMRRTEIARKFDEIVAFAEVERFLDTQVKHYSSGMYLRLAFAVAAHLEPEILLVDEVLAVGDASFQRRCLGKMSDVARSGRTVLFVSHNMEAVQRLCERVIWLERGKIAAEGETEEVVSRYLREWSAGLRSAYRRSGTEELSEDRAVLASAQLLDASGRRCEHLRTGEPFAIRMGWLHHERVAGASYFLRLFDSRDRLLFSTNTHGTDVTPESPGLHTVLCHVDANVLRPGDYTVTLGCYVRPKTVVHKVPGSLGFSVLPVQYDAEVQLHTGSAGAIVAVPTRWREAAAEPVQAARG